MGEFSTVMQTLDFVSGLHNCLEFSQPPLVFISGYANTENVFYCLIGMMQYADVSPNTARRTDSKQG